tara:strand:+ start:82 stop:327 length:246 start_codon:yes stop_codon:yes gene_type:complete
MGRKIKLFITLPLLFLLLLGFLFLPNLAKADEPDLTTDNTQIIEESKILTKEEIDDLLGPDPYLYDSANILDYSNQPQRNN